MRSYRRACRRKLAARARTAWPQLTGVDIRHRSQFAYVDRGTRQWAEHQAHAPALRRLSQHLGFALYLASSDKYEDTILPTGAFAGTAGADKSSGQVRSLIVDDVARCYRAARARVVHVDGGRAAS
jgi:hypothetical protein